MKEFNYTPRGVCSQNIYFQVDDENKLHNVKFTRGCQGNLAAIAKLVEGMDASKVVELLQGNTCGARATSCADQFTKAIMEAINND